MLAALQAEGLTVEELKTRLRERPFGKSGKASRIGRVLANFVGHLEKAMQEDITEEEEQTLSQGMEETFRSTDVIADEAPQPSEPSFKEQESMLAELQKLDPRVCKEDYFDEDKGSWDMDGLQSDLDLARQQQQQLPQEQQQQEGVAADRAPQSSEPSYVEEESMFVELLSLDPRVSKEDYFNEEAGSWDIDGLREDLDLAKQTQQQQPSHKQQQQQIAAAEGAPQSSEPSYVEEESMFAELLTRDPRVSKEDYFDEKEGSWDIDGLREDLNLAKQSQEQPQQEQNAAVMPPLPPFPEPKSEHASQQADGALAEQKLLQLLELDSRVSKEDYFVDGEWDLEGLEDDLQLAKDRAAKKAGAAEESPDLPEAAAQAAAAAAPITVGDTVLAHYEEDGNWYAATVSGAEGEASFRVKWDEDDSTAVVAKDNMKPLPALEVGSKVRAIWAEDGGWYFGEVVAHSGPGSYTVRYDEDGSDAVLKADAVRPYEEPPQMWAAPYEEGAPAPQAGARAEALWKDGDFQGYFGVVVQKANADGTFTVKWDEDASESSVPRAEIRTMQPRFSSDALEIGQPLKGVVTKVIEFGLFVDVGAEEQGLVHRSKVADKFVERLEDIAWEGKAVDTWFIGKNAKGKLDFSMSANKLVASKPTGAPSAVRDFSAFHGLDPNSWLPGKVVNIMAFGAMVEVVPPAGGPSKTGMVHVAEIKAGYVSSVEDELSLGQDVKVRVLGVDTNNKLTLSMKPPA